MRIINEYRNNRITVDFVPKDGATDDDLADTCDGLYRADEQDSYADEAYDNAFEEAVGGGFGAWRLRTEYEDPEDDMSRAKFDVAVDVGPTSSSKRAATVRSLTGMMQLTSDPETQSILTSMALMNMEGEGLSEARKFFRKRLVGMGVVEPTEEEMQQMQEAAQGQQPNPNDMYLQAAAAEAEAKAGKAQADTAHTPNQTHPTCLLYTSPSPRDRQKSRMPSSA